MDSAVKILYRKHNRYSILRKIKKNKRLFKMADYNFLHLSNKYKDTNKTLTKENQ